MPGRDFDAALNGRWIFAVRGGMVDKPLTPNGVNSLQSGVENGTPEQANEFYEKSVLRLLLRRAGYPLVGGRPQANALIEVPPALDGWSRVVIVRYPNRRAFLSLVADPAYAPLAPHKFMALEVVLVPVAGEVRVPDLRLLVGGGLLILYLAVGWVLAALGKP